MRFSKDDDDRHRCENGSEPEYLTVNGASTLPGGQERWKLRSPAGLRLCMVQGKLRRGEEEENGVVGRRMIKIVALGITILVDAAVISCKN